MRIHEDNRRRFLGDMFDTPNGDFNIVFLHPGTVIAWHRHRLQDDRLYAIEGFVTLKAIDPEGNRHEWLLSSEESAPVFIPRGWWHGYGSIDGATLVQFNGPGKWDGSDEERAERSEEMPWTVIP